jgi:hypothetical protein
VGRDVSAADAGFLEAALVFVLRLELSVDVLVVDGELSVFVALEGSAVDVGFDEELSLSWRAGLSLPRLAPLTWRPADVSRRSWRGQIRLFTQLFARARVDLWHSIYNAGRFLLSSGYVDKITKCR